MQEGAVGALCAMGSNCVQGFAMDDFDKRWKRIQDMLGIEARGDKPLVIRSQRTLFGIPSHVEQVIEAVAREEDERCRQLMRQEGDRGLSGVDVEAAE